VLIVTTWKTYALMQDDGNFVLYDGLTSAYWATNTNGNVGAYLLLQGDGNLVVLSAANPPIIIFAATQNSLSC